MTNFVAALAQAEAAMEIFREQNAGHLVMISSMSAMRGMPKTLTTYAATKAGVAHLAEGLRTELHGKPIKVTVLYPGYIRSEMNEKVAAKPRGSGATDRKQSTPLMVSTEKGVRAMVDAIEKEKASAHVPALPWAPLSVVMRHAPIPLLRKLI
jgi:short-subunit dehydrogenase